MSVQGLYDASTRITEAETPEEADFKILLAGAEAGTEEQTVAAQLICRHVDKFPAHGEAAVQALIALAKSADEGVRRNALRELPKLLSIDKKAVAAELFKFLGDADQTVVSIVSPVVHRNLANDKEFRELFLAAIPEATPECQCKMIQIVRTDMKFGEEEVEQAVAVLQAAFKTCVVDGLRLYGKTKKILGDRGTPLIDELLTRLDNSLDANFDDVVKLLVPLLQFTRTMGDDETKKMMDIIAEKVMPKWENLDVSVQLEILHKIVAVPRLVDSEKMIKFVYDIFLTFPKEVPEHAVNYSIIEATLWAFIKLAFVQSKVASNLIGTLLVLTGQPQESEGVEEDDSKYQEFKARLETVQSMSELFVEDAVAKIKQKQSEEALTDAAKNEKSEELEKLRVRKATGTNSKSLAKLLLSSSPLTGKLPQAPSWAPPKPASRKQKAAKKEKKPEKRRDDRDDRRDRRDRDRYDRHDRHRSSDRHDRHSRHERRSHRYD